MTEIVLSELAGGVRTITLNRPERLNAMNPALVAATAEAFEAANGDGETRVILFTGAGRAFCAGDDLRDHRHPDSEAEARAVTEAIQRVTRAIVFSDKMVIGAINGWAVGGGFEWAINCDLAIWGEGARAFFPEVGWGLFVTGAVTTLLPNLVGLTKAKEMMLFGDRYTADELHRLGVAWRLAADDRTLAEARQAAQRIAALPGRAVADMKRALNDAAFADLERALDLETEATVRGFLDPETSSRIAGFAAGD
ncbi:MAG: enoyl-CoA hydratase/isomerase family protein [Alphaproteobacteria bacterium]|mgnify:CR=1 FL=1|nr:enoyl-CoA hydratase/isomerase family protein [Alphaproteobacteria bacterium]MDP6566005.1 enoyl-CoA hydratase/isomerase family protein [Alphaproteobacteria bacterium]MDP6816213.1 enoyl-CoA hydratase/isomerase family protein [Alphaproteobacteria bacterium]